MAKAIALPQSWQHPRQSQFHPLMNQAGKATQHIPSDNKAEALPINIHDTKAKLSRQKIGRDINDTMELPEILYPLTGLEPGP